MGRFGAGLLVGLTVLACSPGDESSDGGELVYAVERRLRLLNADRPGAWREVPSPWDGEDPSARQRDARWSPSGVLVYVGTTSVPVPHWGLVVSDGEVATLRTGGDCSWGYFAEHALVGKLAFVSSEGVVPVGSNGEEVRCTYAHDVEANERLEQVRTWSSSDGESLVTRCPGPEGSAEVFNVRTGEVVWQRDISLGCPRLLVNGPWMLDGPDGGPFVLRDPFDAAEPIELPAGLSATGDVLAPDGRTLLLRDSDIQLFRIQDGAVRPLARRQAEGFPRDWSDDSTRVLVSESCADEENRLVVLSTEDDLTEVFSSPCAPYEQFDLSPDGAAIAATLPSGEDSVVIIVRADGTTELGPGSDAYWRPTPLE